MSQNNGRPPLDFKAAAEAASPQIPIVGQPVTLKKYAFVIEVQCNCPAREPILILGGIGSASVCPACRLAVQVKGVNSDGVNVTWDLVFGRAQAAPDQPLVAAAQG